MTKKVHYHLILIVAFLLLGPAVQAQGTTERGIHFEQQLKWSELLKKAKTEHKYIFVDCYATWCGPCKQMEVGVYSKKEVADVYNKNFIAWKIQMDQTPKDDSLTKLRRDRAKTFEEDYQVNAYPTFLFFDQEGNPVHKVSGSFDVKGFIQLAADAQNPRKQYYVIVKDFEPGKLDTAEEKGLIRTFVNTDEKFAARIAADYLNRIPKTLLKQRYSGGLMERFQDYPQVFGIAVAYLNSLDKRQFVQADNANIVIALIKKQPVKEMAIRHIELLSTKDIDDVENMRLITQLSRFPQIQKIAENYIEQMPEKEKFNVTMVNFLSNYTQTTRERGFQFFYKNTVQIDSAMKSKDYAQVIAGEAIYNSVFTPEFDAAKKTGQSPDFDSIAVVIAKKYNAEYARQVVVSAKIDWFEYLVNDKKESQYWPRLIDAEIDRLKPLLTDSTSFKDQETDINNTVYDYVFPHSDDIAILQLAINWIKELNEVTRNQSVTILDTYACLLYKVGNKGEALAIEKRVLQLYEPHIAQGAQGNVDYTKKVIAAMQNDEKIWTEKEFQ